MDSLAHRFSSRRWPMMMQAQRRVKNTQRATMVLVLRYEVEKWGGDGNKAILSIEVDECVSFLTMVMVTGVKSEETNKLFWIGLRTKWSEETIKYVSSW